MERKGAKRFKNHEESRVAGEIFPQVVVISQTCVPGVREETVMVALMQAGNEHTLLVDALIDLIDYFSEVGFNGEMMLRMEFMMSPYDVMMVRHPDKG